MGSVTVDMQEMDEVAAVEKVPDVADDASSTEEDLNAQLHSAFGTCNESNAWRLLRGGASATSKNKQGMAPLDTAAVAAAASNKGLRCFRNMFNLAVQFEKEKHGSNAANKWNEAVGGSEAEGECEVDLEKIQELSSVQLHCATVKDTEEGPKKSLSNILTSAFKKDQEVKADVLEAVLDRCLFGSKLVVTDVLEADMDGCLPGDEAYTPNKGISLIQYLGSKPALFFRLAKHPTLKGFVEFEWKKKGNRMFWLRFLYYLFQLMVLTFALAIAARPELTDDQINLYPAPIDYFRGICEGIIFIIMVAKVVDEIVEFAFTPWYAYTKDWMNYLQWCSTILTLLIIPFRAVNHPGQWIVAALAYVFHGLKLTEYLSLLRLTGTYVHTMGVVISRDISRFTAIFLAFLIVFSGSFYLSLRYDTSAVIFDGNGTLVSGGGINSDQRRLDGEGSLLHEVYFTGLRSLLESGSVLTYFESGGGFRALSVILYLAFLFMVVIVLLNVLIAQVSDTYTKVLATAPEVYLSHQCWYMARIEQQKYAACLPCLLPHMLRWCLKRIAGSCSIKRRMLPNIAWVGQHVGANRWENTVQKVSKAFSVYGFDEEEEEDANVAVLKTIQAEGHRLEEKMEQTSNALKEKMMSKVDELTDQLKDLKDLLKKIDTTMAEKHVDTHMEEITVDLIN